MLIPKGSMQMEENQGSQIAESGLQEVLERLSALLQGWSRPEKQVRGLPMAVSEGLLLRQRL